MKPSTPSSATSRAKPTVSAVQLSPTFAMTGTRSPTASTTARNSSIFCG